MKVSVSSLKFVLIFYLSLYQSNKSWYFYFKKSETVSRSSTDNIKLEYHIFTGRKQKHEVA